MNRFINQAFAERISYFIHFPCKCAGLQPNLLFCSYWLGSPCYHRIYQFSNENYISTIVWSSYLFFKIIHRFSFWWLIYFHVQINNIHSDSFYYIYYILELSMVRMYIYIQMNNEKFSECARMIKGKLLGHFIPTNVPRLLRLITLKCSCLCT